MKDAVRDLDEPATRGALARRLHKIQPRNLGIELLRRVLRRLGGVVVVGRRARGLRARHCSAGWLTTKPSPDTSSACHLLAMGLEVVGV